ncbi:MAG TPA: hypothetical protein VJ204_01605 [Solirubrobacterales bacterium]|nr:hypothetical protein [Solirubrobacterales bacterium]
MAAEDSRWDVLADCGVETTRLRALIERLAGDFGADQGGYRQMAAITDKETRAVVCDQIGQSAFSISENLLEARLHQRQLEEIVGPDGVRFPQRASAKDTVYRGAEMDMAITGCVRAMGSALDCLAATAIGVMRAPTSITTASFGRLATFNESRKAQGGTELQRRAWQDWARLVAIHEGLPPTGWFPWLGAMRNLNIHRGRQVHMLLQRQKETDVPQMIVFDADPATLNRDAARFDLHLRNRPDLPDMRDLIGVADQADLWIYEPATTTLPGIFKLVNDLVEEAAHFLLSWWRHAERKPGEFPPPVSEWALTTSTGTAFAGISGITQRYPVSYGIANPQLAERLKLAQALREAGT